MPTAKDGRPLSVRAHRGSHSGAAGAGRRLVSCLPPQTFAVCAALVLVVALYTAGRVRTHGSLVWQTTLWKGRPNPDLSLWTSAVETDPGIFRAHHSGLVYLRFNPPEAGQALVFEPRLAALRCQPGKDRGRQAARPLTCIRGVWATRISGRLPIRLRQWAPMFGGKRKKRTSVR